MHLKLYRDWQIRRLGRTNKGQRKWYDGVYREMVSLQSFQANGRATMSILTMSVRIMFREYLFN
jgi:hypothetical protein